jgi:hypothetical protein
MSWIRTNGTVFEDDWRLVDFIKGVTENFAFIKLPQDGKPNFGSCSSDDEPSSIKMQNDTLHDFFNFVSSISVHGNSSDMFTRTSRAGSLMIKAVLG